MTAHSQDQFPQRTFQGLSRPSLRKKDTYEPALERSLRLLQIRSEVLNREREEAPERLARLTGLSSHGRGLLLRNSPSFQTWGLFELLIRAGREETFTDPSQAENFLHLALDVSAHLDSSFYGKE